MKRALALAVLLAACGAEEPGAMTNGAAPPKPGQPDNRIDCLLAGMARAERVCSMEYSQSPDGPVVLLRRPDGGFRRLLRTPERPFYVAADGAEQPVVIQTRDGVTRIQIGGDQFDLR